MFILLLRRQDSQLYDPIHHSCLNSISRPILSSTFLERASSHPHISVLFERKVGKVDWRSRTIYHAATTGGGWVEEGKEQGWDLLVGGDGSWSVVRKEMMREQA
jgi:2-polyprenyl-6-methoxyphenol hydroxylase-like FAD-dependent oxidoreductase